MTVHRAGARSARRGESAMVGGGSADRGVWREHRWVLVLISAAQLLLQLDFSIVNVALPAVQRDLAFTAGSLQWIVTGYAVTYGSLLLLSGRLGDLFGHRRVLILGLGVFAVASLAGGLAVDPVMLIVARLVQGAGAALVAPAALATLAGTFEQDHHRARALGIFQAAAAGGATAGIVLGGVLVQLLGWRSVLLVNPPIIVLLVVLVLWRVPKLPLSSTRPRLDVIGALLVTATLAALVGGMSEGEQLGFGTPAAILLLVASVVLAAVFVIVQRRSSHPMLPGMLFRNRSRVGALLVVMIEFAIVVGYVYFIAQYLQRVLHFSALLTGISLVPATLTVMLTSVLISRRLLPRLGVRLQLAAGLVLVAAGQGMLSLLGPSSSYGLIVVPGLLLTALGMGISIPAAAFAANSDVPPHLRGAAGGLFVTAQQSGAAVGLAALATIAAATTTATGSLSGGYHAAYLACVALALLAAVVALLIIPRKRAVGTSSPGTARA